MTKKLAILVLKLAITGALFYHLFSHLGLENVIGPIKDCNRMLLAASFLLALISMFIQAFQWKELLNINSLGVKYFQALKLFFVGLFFTNFLPGSMGGDAVKIYSIRRIFKRGREGLAATFIDRFAGLFTLSLFSVFFSAYVLLRGDFFVNRQLFIFIGSVFSLILISAVVLFSRRIGGFIHDRFLYRLSFFNLSGRILAVQSFLWSFRSDTGMIFRIASISFLIQFLRIVSHFLLALSIGLNSVEFTYFLIFIPVIALAASLPVSFGGLGIREGVGRLLFGLVTNQTALAVATEFLASLMTIFISMAGGVIFIFDKSTERRRKTVLLKKAGGSE